MYPHLRSNIYHLESCIALTADSRLCSNHYSGAPHPPSAAKPLPLISASSAPLRFKRLCILSLLSTRHSVLSTFPLRPAPVFPPLLRAIDTVAAMTEPTAALGGSSRASRPPMTHFQRLFGGFPSAIAADNLSQRPAAQAVQVWLIKTRSLLNLSGQQDHQNGLATVKQRRG